MQFNRSKETRVFINRLFHVLIVIAILSACAPRVESTPAPVTALATSTEEPNAVPALSFAHTACTQGVDLSGQVIPFYHILNPYDQVETVYQPLRAGYADAAEYFNAHGGICGATLEQVFDETHWDAGDAASIYSLFSALQPKPVIVTIYGSREAEIGRASGRGR